MAKEQNGENVDNESNSQDRQVREGFRKRQVRTSSGTPGYRWVRDLGSRTSSSSFGPPRRRI